MKTHAIFLFIFLVMTETTFTQVRNRADIISPDPSTLITQSVPKDWLCGMPLLDPRDNQSYNTVQIGSQCWMAENLNTGLMIISSEYEYDNDIIEKYCYDDLDTNCDVYGGLYWWDEAMDYVTAQGSRGICPTGWHIPTDEEWCILTLYLDSEVNCNSIGPSGIDAGGKMKETGTAHWLPPNTGATNSSGFTGLPGGRMSYSYEFSDMNVDGLFWSSTIDWNVYSWARLLKNSLATVDRYEGFGGYSVRCIIDPLRADFGSNNNIICPDSGVIFSNQSSGAPTSWTWNFPGGSPSFFEGQNPPQVFYTATGSYDVSLTVSDGNSSDTETKTGYITVKDVIALFSGTPDTVVIGETVTFTDLSSCDPETWDWSFPGGTPSSFSGQTPPAITYDTTGTFDVTLTVTKEGTADIFTIIGYIIVIPHAFNMTNDTVTTCIGNFYDSGGPTGNYQDNEDFTMTFSPATPGAMIRVSFTMFDTEQGYDFLRIYDGAGTDAPLIGTYHGTTGPGTVMATNVSGALTFHYTSDYSVIKAGWSAGINCQLPDADFSADQTSICPDSGVIFTNQSLGYQTSWTWSFPGGSPSSFEGQTPPQVFYAATGTYDVSLTVSDGNHPDTETKTGYITVKDLIANFSGAPVKVVIGNTVTFTDNSSCDPVTWDWSFPGGTPSSFTGQAPPAITYNTIGTYDVALTVIKPGATDTFTRTGYIKVIPPVFNMADDTITTCSGDFYDSGGPDGNYQDNENFTMTFYPADPGMMILVNFTGFHTEPGYDYLRIYDGEGTDAPLIGTYHGTNGPGTVTATNVSGALTFKFTSDYSVRHEGWSAIVYCCTFSSDDSDCDGVLNEVDNCLYDWNPGQEDDNGDGIGDACTCRGHIAAHHVAGNVAPVDKTVIYSIITNVPSEPSKCWISSNLGAGHPATAVGDTTEASAGWYWQFNRMQGYKHDGVTRTPNTAWITGINENSEWTAENDPCTLELGSEWRIPTVSEWDNIDENQGWDDWNGPWNAALKMHASGRLGDIDGLLYDRGAAGYYWSNSGNNNPSSWSFNFSSDFCGVSGNPRAGAFSVRCLSDILLTTGHYPDPGMLITVYPNPGDGLFEVKISSAQPELIQLKISNILGKTILIRSVRVMGHETYPLNLEVCPDGIYILEAGTGSEWLSRKIIKK